MPSKSIPFRQIGEVERLAADLATLTSTTQRNIVLEFTSSAGFRRFFEAMHLVDEDLWGKARTWYLLPQLTERVGRLRLLLHVPLADVPAVAEVLREVERDHPEALRRKAAVNVLHTDESTAASSAAVAPEATPRRTRKGT